ncbi:MAG: YkgJ family cysteine cluster protein [Nitrospiraceae bacterium]|nr:MAG: YkgJ family cysteine cluster protein [Nitrospiraceae bacterium]
MKKPKENLSKQLRFPDDEARFPWLAILLDSYAIIDEGLSAAIDKEEAGRNRKLACEKGCDICCRVNKDIPIYPIELVGIYWFATEKAEQALRETLKKQLSSHTENDPCPFLVNGLCFIYGIRPISCRQFGVFNKPCDEGEDPYHTRRDDVLTPIEDYTKKAFLATLPFYGIIDEEAKINFIENNLIHAQAINLQEYDWKKLVKIMDDFDSKKK